jgi:hypothetical protein
MSYNLFLDDIFTPTQIAELPNISVKDKTRYRTYNWKIIKTYEDFIKIITENGLPDIVSFDHDLHEEHWEFIFNDENWDKIDSEINIDYDIFSTKTGYHAAEWLIEFCSLNSLNIPICLVHSQNPIGRKNINNLLF